MAEGRLGHDWAQTSTLLAMLANCHRDPKKTRAFSPKDFNPIEKLIYEVGTIIHGQQKISRADGGVSQGYGNIKSVHCPEVCMPGCFQKRFNATFGYIQGRRLDLVLGSWGGLWG